MQASAAAAAAVAAAAVAAAAAASFNPLCWFACPKYVLQLCSMQQQQQQQQQHIVFVSLCSSYASYL